MESKRRCPPLPPCATSRRWRRGRRGRWRGCVPQCFAASWCPKPPHSPLLGPRSEQQLLGPGSGGELPRRMSRGPSAQLHTDSLASCCPTPGSSGSFLHLSRPGRKEGDWKRWPPQAPREMTLGRHGPVYHMQNDPVCAWRPRLFPSHGRGTPSSQQARKQLNISAPGKVAQAELSWLLRGF